MPQIVVHYIIQTRKIYLICLISVLMQTQCGRQLTDNLKFKEDPGFLWNTKQKLGGQKNRYVSTVLTHLFSPLEYGGP